jgi:hypothetical protein
MARAFSFTSHTFTPLKTSRILLIAAFSPCASAWALEEGDIVHHATKQDDRSQTPALPGTSSAY